MPELSCGSGGVDEVGFFLILGGPYRSTGERRFPLGVLQDDRDEDQHHSKRAFRNEYINDGGFRNDY